MNSLRQNLIQYIKVHRQVHFRDIEKYAEDNGYKAYTAVRRLQEVRDDAETNSHFDPEIGTIEENGTIKFYVYFPGRTREEAIKAKNAAQPIPSKDFTPKAEPRAVQPVTPAYEPKMRPKPYVWKPTLKCCDVAIYCQDKRLPISHQLGCAANN
jgi:hypothetical protein